MMEYRVDTDQQRDGSIYESARRKCELALEIPAVDYALASEGSFQFHPSIPFLACHQEVLHFIDRRRGFHLTISHFSTKTNYRMQVVDTREDLENFALQSGFPSHSLLLQPNDAMDPSVVFTGINTLEELEVAFQDSLRHSQDGKVWAKTDMCAHRNPSRMAVIQEASDKLARRLSMACPACGAPGWGSIYAQESWEETPQKVIEETHGCVLCPYTESTLRPGGLLAAP